MISRRGNCFRQILYCNGTNYCFSFSSHCRFTHTLNHGITQLNIGLLYITPYGSPNWLLGHKKLNWFVSSCHSSQKMHESWQIMFYSLDECLLRPCWMHIQSCKTKSNHVLTHFLSNENYWSCTQFVSATLVIQFYIFKYNSVYDCWLQM